MDKKKPCMAWQPWESIASQPFIGNIGVVFVFIGMAIFLLKSYNLSRPEENAPSLNSSGENVEEKELLLIGDRFNLTKRELNIVTLIFTGYSNKQISEKLLISQSTSKFHVRNVLRKMNASNRHKIREKVSRHLTG